MRIGYGSAFQHLSNASDSTFIAEQIDLCLAAEACGFSSLWLPEHHFTSYAIMPNPIQMLTYLAAKTHSIRLGVGVAVLPWHHPVRLAEDLLLLDELSHGRLIVGVGRGLARAEYDGFGIDLNSSRDLFLDHAKVLLRCLETGIIEDGATNEMPQHQVRPKPSRTFVERIFSAAVSMETLDIAAKLGMGLLLVNLKPPAALRESQERFETQWQIVQRGSPAPRPIHSSVVFVDEDGARAAEKAREFGATSFRASVAHYGMAETDFGKAKGYGQYRSMRIRDEAEIDEAAEAFVQAMPHGTPQQVLHYYDQCFRELMPQELIIHFHFGTMPVEEAVRNVECFAKNCLPELKSWV